MGSLRRRGRGQAVSAAVAAAAAIHLLAASPAAFARQPPASPPKELAIIVHKSNPIEALSRAELRRIFLLETQTWPHGRKITVVLREKGQRERGEAIEAICDMREADFDQQVFFQTFRGSVSQGHRTIRSASAMVRFVFNAPGAIGYVYSDEADDTTRVVRIDGRVPGEPGYPLRVAARSAAATSARR